MGNLIKISHLKWIYSKQRMVIGKSEEGNSTESIDSSCVYLHIIKLLLKLVWEEIKFNLSSFTVSNPSSLHF